MNTKIAVAIHTRTIALSFIHYKMVHCDLKELRQDN